MNVENGATNCSIEQPERFVLKFSRELWEKTAKNRTKRIGLHEKDTANKKRKSSFSFDIYDFTRCSTCGEISQCLCADESDYMYERPELDNTSRKLRPFLAFSSSSKNCMEETYQIPIVLLYIRKYVSIIPKCTRRAMLLDIVKQIDYDNENSYGENGCKIKKSSACCPSDLSNSLKNSIIYNFSVDELSQHLVSLRIDAIQRTMRPALQKLIVHPRNLNLFNKPVDTSLIDYYEKIKYPMDLGTVKSKLQQGLYESFQACISDIMLIFDNAMTYNPPSHIIYEIARLIRTEFEADVIGLLEKNSKESERKIAHTCNSCNGGTCLLCGEKCLKFEPPVFVCQGSCNQRIKKGSIFHITEDGMYQWCQKCFASLPPLVSETSYNGKPIFKKNLLKRRLDEEVSEPWIQCNFCDGWMHQICALFDDRVMEVSEGKFMCSMCIIEHLGAQFLKQKGLTHENIVNESFESIYKQRKCTRWSETTRHGIKKVNSTSHEENRESNLNSVNISSDAMDVVVDDEFESSEKVQCPHDTSVGLGKSVDDNRCHLESTSATSENSSVNTTSNVNLELDTSIPFDRDDDTTSEEDTNRTPYLQGNLLSPTSQSEMLIGSHCRGRASHLPRSKLSDFLETMIQARMEESGFSNVSKTLTVRMVSNVEQALDVPQVMIDNFMTPDGNRLPNQLPYRQKCILLFQEIDGVDVCLFCLYAQEFSSSCPPPNDSIVYIAYLDSVDYFRPMDARTLVYHEIMVGYLKWVQARGFQRCHIWACPPQRGDNFIFWCHPPHQRTPSRERLNSWYQSILARCVHVGIVEDVSNMYDRYFQGYTNREREDVQKRQAAKNSFVGQGKTSMRSKSVTDLEAAGLTSDVKDQEEQPTSAWNSGAVTPPVFEGDFWVLECYRAHRSVSHRIRGYDGKDVVANSRRARECLKNLMSKPIALPFSQPVDPVALNIPDYLKIISHPMDLGTVKDKIRNAQYEHMLSMAQDVRLTFSNAMTFNPPGHPIYLSAESLLKDFETQLAEIVALANSEASGGTKPTYSPAEVDSHLEKYRLQAKVENTSFHPNYWGNSDARSVDGSGCSVISGSETPRSGSLPRVQFNLESFELARETSLGSRISDLTDIDTNKPYESCDNHSEQGFVSRENGVDEEGDDEIPPPGRLQRTDSVISAISDISTAGDWSKPTLMFPSLANGTKMKLLGQYVPQKFEKPALGERGIQLLMSEVSKSAQRLKDDLFVIKFADPHQPLLQRENLIDSCDNDADNQSVASGTSSISSALYVKGGKQSLAHILRKGLPRLESVGLGANTISASAEDLLQALTIDTSDPDMLMQSPLVDTRHTFLEMSQYHHMQFDSLRRAKHSSSLLLHHLHNPFDESTRPHCSHCRQAMRDVRWHCDQCPNFDICQGCFDTIGCIPFIDTTQINSKKSSQIENKIMPTLYENPGQGAHEHPLTPFRISYI